jgi:hypothetical protein
MAGLLCVLPTPGADRPEQRHGRQVFTSKPMVSVPRAESLTAIALPMQLPDAAAGGFTHVHGESAEIFAGERGRG